MLGEYLKISLYFVINHQFDWTSVGLLKSFCGLFRIPISLMCGIMLDMLFGGLNSVFVACLGFLLV
jgi:hypothetical protein